MTEQHRKKSLKERKKNNENEKINEVRRDEERKKRPNKIKSK